MHLREWGNHGIMENRFRYKDHLSFFHYLWYARGWRVCKLVRLVAVCRLHTLFVNLTKFEFYSILEIFSSCRVGEDNQNWDKSVADGWYGDEDSLIDVRGMQPRNNARGKTQRIYMSGKASRYTTGKHVQEMRWMKQNNLEKKEKMKVTASGVHMIQSVDGHLYLGTLFPASKKCEMQ